MEKTYSQKVARIFEIVDYFLLIPAAIGAFFGFFVLVGSPFTAWYAILFYVFLVVGLVLMVGYFRHSRGYLDEQNISFLWITSVVYNFLLLLPWLYGAASILQGDGLKYYEDNFNVVQIYAYFFLVSIVLGYIAAIVFSIKAYSFEKRKKYL